MALTATNKGGGEPVPEGLHQAICYGIYDLGTHTSNWQGKAIRKHKVLIQFELPEVRGDFERDGVKVNLPRAISLRLTLSTHAKATMRKYLESWRGRKFTVEEESKFDILKLLGVNAYLQVLHEKKDGQTYANITSVLPLPKGFEKRLPENPARYFSMEEGTDIPPNTPEWVIKIIQASEEWSGETQGHAEEDSPPVGAYDGETSGDNSDIPF